MDSTLRDFKVPKEGENIIAITITNFESLTSEVKIEDCLRACPNLKILSITLYNYQLPKEYIDFTFEDIIIKIAKYGSKIEALDFAGPFFLDEDLKHISQENFPQLRKISLMRCSNITAKGIKFIASQCPNLSSLHLLEPLSLYRELGKTAEYIGEFLPNLKRLAIYRSNLTDSGLITIAKGCPNLEIIEVARNYELTDKSLRKIGENCKALIAIDMNHNKKITEKGLECLINNCTNFKYFNQGGWGRIRSIEDVKWKYPQISFSKPFIRIKQ